MTHDERVYHHLYVDAKSPLENAERIASLEELVLEVWRACPAYEDDCKRCNHYIGDDDE